MCCRSAKEEVLHLGKFAEHILLVPKYTEAKGRYSAYPIVSLACSICIAVSRCSAAASS